MKRLFCIFILLSIAAVSIASNSTAPLTTPQECYQSADNDTRIDTVSKDNYKQFKQKLIDEGWTIVDIKFDGPNNRVIITSTRISQSKIADNELEKLYAQYQNVDKSSWERDPDWGDGLWHSGPFFSKNGERFVYTYLVKDGYFLEVRRNGEIIEGCHKFVIYGIK